MAAQIQSFWSRVAQIRERTIPESHQSSQDDDTDSNDEDQMGDDDVAHRMFEKNVNESIESVQAQIFDETLTAAGYEQHIENTIETVLARMRDNQQPRR